MCLHSSWGVYTLHKDCCWCQCMSIIYINIELCIKHLQRVTTVHGSWMTQSYQENRSVWHQFVTLFFFLLLFFLCSLWSKFIHYAAILCVCPYYSAACDMRSRKPPTILAALLLLSNDYATLDFLSFFSHLHVLFSHSSSTLCGNTNSEKSSKILPLCFTGACHLLTGVAQPRDSSTRGRCWQYRASK